MSAPWQRVAGTPRPGPPAAAPASAPPPAPAAEPAAAEPVPEPCATAVPGEVTGLAAAVAELDALAELPVSEHAARYDALHGRLSDALTSIDGI